MRPLPKRSIAARYLPSRYHYWYAFSKLATDPVYEAARTVFAQTNAALLDVGCGIGLLPQSLRASGLAVKYQGLDIDAGKIELARTAAAKAGLKDVRFDIGDLAANFPEHRGSVALLDVLQYFQPQDRIALLGKVARCIAPEGRLIIRAGLEDRSWRAVITRSADRFGHLVRWMGPAPVSQPTAADLTRLLGSYGLTCELRPLAGRMPFNNWLLVGRLRDAAAA